MIKIVLLITLITQFLKAQTIQGTFPQLKNNEIVLIRYDGFIERELAKITSDSLGNFFLRYPVNYRGAALLQPKGVSSVIILLNHENLKIQWDDLQDFKTLHFTNSPENEAFAKSIVINQEADQKLAGLKYLLPLYEKQSKSYQWLQKEIANQENSFPAFVKTLPVTSYAVYYLQLRKLIMDMPLTANRYIDRIPQHEKAFAAIDFNDGQLWTSGLLRELLDGFYQLMESHIDIEKVTQHCNLGTAAWIQSLANNPTKQQEVAEHCFKWLEKRSLFGAAEYLAKAMLNQSNCQLDEKRTHLFEQYRKMGIGMIAPNSVFEPCDGCLKAKDLESINSKYKLVVFGASGCPNCQTEYPSLVGKYKNLKEKFDVEVVYFSLDTDIAVFENYYNEAPFITYCDTKGWESQAAKDFHVFATPTYFLLDKELKILAKIVSPEHLEAWLVANKKDTAN